MVTSSRTTVAIQALQLLAVLAVCFNHWSISLLKGVPSFFSEAAYREPALFGLMFLFTSSGFLTHSYFSERQAASVGRDIRLDFVVSRYWRLALPAIAAVGFDYFVQGFADQSQTNDVLRALPFLLTLTQTWHYAVLGATSLAEPTGGSNMAWLGSDLFFLTIFYGVTVRFWQRELSPRTTSGLLCLCVAIATTYFWGLGKFTHEIANWAGGRYGLDLGIDYTLVRWLYKYCPYIYLPAFVSGVLIAHLNQSGNVQLLSRVPIFLLGISLLIPTPAKYLCWALLLMILTIRWSFIIEEGSPWDKRLVTTGLLARLGTSAYEIYVLHLLIFLAFTLSATPGLSAYNITLLFGRVLAVNLLMILLCVGLSESYFSRWQARIIEGLGFANCQVMRHV